MPAETVHEPNGMFDVRVSWGHDSGYIQVATRADKGTEHIVRIVNEWLEAAALPAVDLDALRKKLGENPPHFDGWHATLDNRRNVNDLIRHLRKARDSAFGRDE